MATPGSYSEYEYSMALALSSHPGLVAFDDMNFYSTEKGKDVGSSWDTSPLSGTVDEADDYDDSTVRVDVFQVQLCDPREQQVRKRPFKFYPAIRVISSSITGVMPSADIIMVDAFPITRQTVLEAIRRHLLRTEYATDNNEFLWGPELQVIRPDK